MRRLDLGNRDRQHAAALLTHLTGAYGSEVTDMTTSDILLASSYRLLLLGSHGA